MGLHQFQCFGGVMHLFTPLGYHKTQIDLIYFKFSFTSA